MECLRTYNLFQISLYHLIFGVSFVSLTAFMVLHLGAIGLDDIWIALNVSIMILAGVSRPIWGYISDRTNERIKIIFVGNYLAAVVLILIPFFTESILLPLVVGAFGLSLSISGPSADALLIDLTSEEPQNVRDKASGALHSMRILGMALGGFIGFIFYSVGLEFFHLVVFCSFLIIIATPVSVYGLKTKKDKVPALSFLEPFTEINQKVVMMSLFLVVYSIGLWMQEPLMELFLLKEFNVPDDRIGMLVGIMQIVWAGGILLAIIATGFYFSRKFGRKKTAITGLAIAGLGLGLVSQSHSVPFLFGSVFVFGIGLGLSSTPMIAIMMNIAQGEKGKNPASLIAIFGVMDSLGKAIGSTLGGITSTLLSGYRPAFLVEMGIILFTIVLVLAVKDTS